MVPGHSVLTSKQCYPVDPESLGSTRPMRGLTTLEGTRGLGVPCLGESPCFGFEFERLMFTRTHAPFLDMAPQLLSPRPQKGIKAAHFARLSVHQPTPSPFRPSLSLPSFDLLFTPLPRSTPHLIPIRLSQSLTNISDIALSSR